MPYTASEASVGLSQFPRRAVHGPPAPAVARDSVAGKLAIPDHSGFTLFDQSLERGAQDFRLHLLGKRAPKRVTELEADRVHGPRRAHQTGRLRVEGDKHRRYAHHLNIALNRDHGSMAQRSPGCQHNGVRPRAVHFLRDGGRGDAVDLI